MLHVTPRGVEALEQLLRARHVPSAKGVRVVSSGDHGFRFLIDAPRPGDDVVRDQGTPVLLADADVSARLDQRLLDIRPDAVAESRRFRLLRRRPRQGPPTLH